MSKILVIDDEETVRDLISILLTNNGFEVVTAKDGEDGLKIFNESTFDLVITDLIMPKYDGNEIAKRIRASEKKIPLIGITAIPEGFDKNYLDVIIEKPFSADELTDIIKSII